jgi:hypothetical protein
MRTGGTSNPRCGDSPQPHVCPRAVLGPVLRRLTFWLQAGAHTGPVDVRSQPSAPSPDWPAPPVLVLSGLEFPDHVSHVLPLAVMGVTPAILGFVVYGDP